jgi:Carboxypeptidase activation peptide
LEKTGSVQFDWTMKYLLLVVLAILGSACAEQKSYRGYKTYAVTPATTAEYDLLKEWELVIGIDYWDGLKTRGPSRVMVTPELQDEFVRFLGDNLIEFSVLIEDVEE